VANHKDAAKRALQAVKRRLRNRANRTRMRNQIASLRTVLTSKDPAAIQAEFREAVSVIQSLATKGVIHRNQAARRVARLAAAVKKATTPG
jgi:small subunit ribosomal protein S20